MAISAISEASQKASSATVKSDSAQAAVKSSVGHIVAYGLVDDRPGKIFYVEVRDESGICTKGFGTAESWDAFAEENLYVGDAVALCIDDQEGITLCSRVGLPVVAKSNDGIEEEENSFRHVVIGGEQTEASIRPAGSLATKKNATNDAVEKLDTPEHTNRPATLLNGRFVRDEAGIYRRQGEAREALADEGEKIRFIDKQMDAFEAGIELARLKGWKAIEVSGSEKFRSDGWFHAKAAGLDVVGYEPNANDLKRLESHQNATAKSIPPAVDKESSKDISASANEAFDKAIKEGFGVVSINTEKGRYAGRIIHESAHHLVQENGRKTAVIHNKRDLDPAYRDFTESSKSLKVTYQAGRGNVGSSMDIETSRGR